MLEGKLPLQRLVVMPTGEQRIPVAADPVDHVIGQYAPMHGDGSRAGIRGIEKGVPDTTMEPGEQIVLIDITLARELYASGGPSLREKGRLQGIRDCTEVVKRHTGEKIQIWILEESAHHELATPALPGLTSTLDDVTVKYADQGVWGGFLGLVDEEIECVRGRFVDELLICAGSAPSCGIREKIYAASHALPGGGHASYVETTPPAPATECLLLDRRVVAGQLVVAPPGKPLFRHTAH